MGFSIELEKSAKHIKWGDLENVFPYFFDKMGVFISIRFPSCGTLNPIQDMVFRGCSGMGEGGLFAPLKTVTHILQ